MKNHHSGLHHSGLHLHLHLRQILHPDPKDCLSPKRFTLTRRSAIIRNTRGLLYLGILEGCSNNRHRKVVLMRDSTAWLTQFTELYVPPRRLAPVSPRPVKTRDIQMARSEHKNISNRSQCNLASSEHSSPTMANTGYPNIQFERGFWEPD